MNVSYYKTGYAQKDGFTFVELSLFMGIFAILLLMLTAIFFDALEVRREIEATSAVSQDGSYILSRLQYDIARAESIVLPSAPGEQGNVLQLTIDGITYSYAHQNDAITLTRNGTTDALNGTETTISNLNFLRLGAVGGKNSIRISFTTTSKTLRPKGPEIVNFQTTVNQR